MKSLNPQAVKVLTALLECKERIQDNDSGKQREVQAKVANTVGQYRFINLTYYLNDEGFLFREPEITICHDTKTGEYLPMSIIYEDARILSTSINLVYGRLELFNEKIQSDHAEITDRLLTELGERQDLL